MEQIPRFRVPPSLTNFFLVGCFIQNGMHSVIFVASANVRKFTKNLTFLLFFTWHSIYVFNSFFLSNLLCFFPLPVHYHFAHCNFVQRNAFGNNTKPVIVEKMPSNTLKKIQSMSHRKIGMIQRKQNKQIQIKTEINLKNANVPQSK